MGILRELFKRRLLRKNIVLSRPPGQFSVGEYKLRRLQQRGFVVERAVDGGAAEGGWTASLKEVYPNAAILAVEPREDAQIHLQQLGRNLSKVVIAQTLLGAETGQVPFHVSKEQSSVLLSNESGHVGKVRDCPITTMDELVERLNFGYPDLIKLDLQGYELTALKGATRCMRHAQAVLLEVSFLPFYQGMPLLYDVVTFMHDQGYELYDVWGLWHRPLDGALAQGDVLFLKADHPLRKDHRWSQNG
ncbi:MAG: FkbM family methyltransferase [Phycisphaeraceae bacterium]